MYITLQIFKKYYKNVINIRLKQNNYIVNYSLIIHINSEYQYVKTSIQ